MGNFSHSFAVNIPGIHDNNKKDAINKRKIYHITKIIPIFAAIKLII